MDQAARPAGSTKPDAKEMAQIKAEIAESRNSQRGIEKEITDAVKNRLIDKEHYDPLIADLHTQLATEKQREKDAIARYGAGVTPAATPQGTLSVVPHVEVAPQAAAIPGPAAGTAIPASGIGGMNDQQINQWLGVGGQQASPGAVGQGLKPLDQNTARTFFHQAGGDPDKARKMARDQGYQF